MRDKYLNDRAFGYGHAKQALMAKIEERFGPATDRYEDLKKHPDDLNDVLADGAKRARELARKTTDEARRAAGIGR